MQIILSRVFSELVAHARSELISNAERSSEARIQISQTIDVRYQGQSNTLNIPWQNLQNIEQAFHQKHKGSYGHDLDVDIELVNLRVRAIEQRHSFQLPAWQATEASKDELTTMPSIGNPVAVINRAGLNVGQKIAGPALITEISSTTWIAEGWSAVVDAVGNLALFKE